MEESSLLLVIAKALPEVVTALTVLATILVRLTPTKRDDAAVSSLGKKVFKAVQWLPTFGINPQTKALEKALEEANAKLEALEKK
jgi:hypothetical protein